MTPYNMAIAIALTMSMANVLFLAHLIGQRWISQVKMRSQAFQDMQKLITQDFWNNVVRKSNRASEQFYNTSKMDAYHITLFGFTFEASAFGSGTSVWAGYTMSELVKVREETILRYDIRNDLFRTEIYKAAIDVLYKISHFTAENSAFYEEIDHLNPTKRLGTILKKQALSTLEDHEKDILVEEGLMTPDVAKSYLDSSIVPASMSRYAFDVLEPTSLFPS